VKVSVVIPAYNHEKFIGAAIDSVLNQSLQDFELIIVDDGSTDATAAVIKSYSDPRIHYFYQTNQDAFNTINRGMVLAKGRFIAILNSDDIYATDRLRRLVEYQKETEAQCLFTDVIPISDAGAEFTDPDFGWNVWHRKNRDFYQQAEDLYAAFLKGNFMVTTSNLFMTREAVEKVGNFCSLRYLHDYDFIFRMMLEFPDGVHYLSAEKLLYYRIHDGNTLGEAAIAGREQDQKLIRKYMLMKVDGETKKYVRAGSDRMVELQQELNDVLGTLSRDSVGIRNSLTSLLLACKRKIIK